MDPVLTIAPPSFRCLRAARRDIEVSEDIRPERLIELFVSDVGQRFLMVLVGGIVDEDVQPSELTGRAVYRLTAEPWVLYVAGDGQTAASLLVDMSAVSSASTCSSGL